MRLRLRVQGSKSILQWVDCQYQLVSISIDLGRFGAPKRFESHDQEEHSLSTSPFMPTEPFKALKVPSNNTLTAPAPSNISVGGSMDAKTISRPEDISSPHELTAFVETLLGQLETKFDDMSSQILDRSA
jgi:Heat shock factor binding protein 1